MGMRRNRAAGIVIKDRSVLLIYRINKGDEYWVFPGGGQEAGETPEETALREIREETTVQVKLSKFLYHIYWDTGEENFFYLCEYVSGEPKLDPSSEEYTAMRGGDQVYEPMWVDISLLPTLRLYQLEIRDAFLEDYTRGFSPHVRIFHIDMAKRRHS